MFKESEIKEQHMKKVLMTTVFMLATLMGLRAQNVAVKTNLLYDATATVNLGVEVGLAPRWSLDLSGNYNGWVLGKDFKMKHWLIQPEARYWLCERFNGHFFGLHAHGGEYNVANVKLPFGIYPGLDQYRNQGYYYGAGIGYGYHWILSKRWSLEAEVGVGYIGTDFERFYCVECGTKIGDYHKDYFGLTKLSVTLVFMID